MSEIPSNWYEDFFHGVPLDLWRQAIPPEKTMAEADFLVKVLRLDPGSHLLDVPCGNGRLTFELAKRGFRLTGVDISEEFIEEAQLQMNPPATAGGTDFSAQSRTNPPADAGGNDSIAQVEFVLGDMRRIEGEAIYDGAFCFGNSFGFLEYADMESFLNGVARALKSGARFVIATGMAAESILPKFEVESSHQIGDILVTIREQYLPDESCVDSEYIFERGGKTESRKAKHWIYTAGEIRRMLERAGFRVKDLYGSTKCDPFVLGADWLFVIAERS